MTVTVKLDATLEAQLRLRAAASGRSASDVIRAALQSYLAQPADADIAARSAHSLGADLFGRHGGAADLAANRKRELAAAWADKRRSRQPRG